MEGLGGGGGGSKATVFNTIMYVCLVFPIADSFWEVSDYGKHLVMVLSPLGTKLIWTKWDNFIHSQPSATLRTASV